VAILKYDTPDGEILIETSSRDAIGSVRAKGYATSPSEEVLDAGGFETTIGRVKAIGSAFARTIGEIEVAPTSAEVELALKFTGKAGVIISSVGTEAQMKVKLSWKPEQKQKISDV